jgi:hypothetical protein
MRFIAFDASIFSLSFARFTALGMTARTYVRRGTVLKIGAWHVSQNCVGFAD